VGVCLSVINVLLSIILCVEEFRFFAIHFGGVVVKANFNTLLTALYFCRDPFFVVF